MRQQSQQRAIRHAKNALMTVMAAGIAMFGGPVRGYAQDAPIPASQPAASQQVAADKAAGHPPTEGGQPAPATGQNVEPDSVPAPGGAGDANPLRSGPVLFDPQMVEERARKLAAKPFEAPQRELPDALASLSPEAYGQIRFKAQSAFFSPARPGFSLELFHPGNMYDVPVAINLVRDGELQVIPYSAGLFDFGGTGLSANDFSTLDYSGFRLRYPVSNIGSNDELARFLGASHFRLQGQGQSIGQMARGLAIDLAGPSGEEIPVFREFWIIAPKPGDRDITVHALLDSPRVTGAYRFVITPGSGSHADIQAHLFFRDQVDKVGLAPLNSMFLYGEQRRRHFDDYRGEVHSSDGLLIHNGRGEWLWRPLDNPVNLQISSFLDENPRGFGLLQRDRDFDHYQDLENRFDQQPGYWVTPMGDWGRGHVELVEIPSPSETNDNIVAYWVPETRPSAGSEMAIAYRVTATTAGDNLHDMAQVTDTRIMRLAGDGDDETTRTRFVLNFAGGDLAYFTANMAGMRADISTSNGEIANTRILADPENGGVRVIFDLLGASDASSCDLRAFLLYDRQVLSETWTMPWVF